METLRKRIEAQKDGTFISIGAISGFIYQGPKEDAIPFFENATELWVEFLKSRLSKLKKQIQTSTRYIAHRMDLITDIVEKPAMDPDIENGKYLIEHFSEQIKQSMKLIAHRQKMLAKYTEDILTFEPFLDRYVVNEYRKSVDSGVALIIDGPEEGQWFIGDKEVRTDFKQKEWMKICL